MHWQYADTLTLRLLFIGTFSVALATCIVIALAIRWLKRTATGDLLGNRQTAAVAHGQVPDR